MTCDQKPGLTHSKTLIASIIQENQGFKFFTVYVCVSLNLLENSEMLKRTGICALRNNSMHRTIHRLHVQ